MPAVCKLTNLSFADDSITYLATEIASVNKNQHKIAILPSQRSVRALSAKLPLRSNCHTISYSEIPTNLNLFRHHCNPLDETFPHLLDPFSFDMVILELVEDLRKCHPTFKAFSDNKVDSYLKKFLIKFFTYNDNIPYQPPNSTEYEIFYDIIKSFQQKVTRSGKILEQYFRNLAIHRLEQAWNIHENFNKLLVNQSGYHPIIYAILPPTNTPYILKFLGIIATIPSTEIIIHGLSQIDLATWDDITAKHPKFFIKNFMQRLHRAPNSIKFKFPDHQPSSQITYIEAKNLPDEAEQISTIANQFNTQNIGIITNNRILAKLIKEALKLHHLAPDDTVSQTFIDLNESKFLLLLLKLIEYVKLNKVHLLAFLKHPLASVNRSIIEAFEIKYLRTPKCYNSLSDLRQYLDQDQEYAEIIDIIDKILFFQRSALNQHTFMDFLSWHINYFAHFINHLDSPIMEYLNNLKSDIAPTNFASRRITFNNYQVLLLKMLSRELYRTENPTDNIKIITPIEARLQQFDIIIIPDLNEGSFPSITQDWPIIDNVIAAHLNFPHHNENIGITRYDFESFIASHNQVILSRAVNILGREAIESRFLLELRTQRQLQQSCLRNSEKVSAISTDNIRANPKPPISARPFNFSVSSIERLMCNPYVYYARDILNLIPLEALDAPPSHRQFGVCLHRALSKAFNKLHLQTCKEFTEDILNQFKSYAKSRYGIEDFILGMWVARVRRIAPWLYDYEQELAQHYTINSSEQKYSTNIIIQGKTITLYAICDRIIAFDHIIKIIDYKTGYAPSQIDVDSGTSPQLALENLILSRIFPTYSITQEYIELRGKKEIAHIKPIKADAVITHTEIEKLIAQFLDEKMGYFAITDLERHHKYKEYHHLINLFI